MESGHCKHEQWLGLLLWVILLGSHFLLLRGKLEFHQRHFKLPRKLGSFFWILSLLNQKEALQDNFIRVLGEKNNRAGKL